MVVTASVMSGEATITGGAEATSEHGVARFKDLAIIGRLASPVVLRFSIGHRSGVGFTVKNSQPIALQVGPPATIRAADQAPFNGAVGASVSPAPAVLVLDAGQNPVPNVAVTFSVVQGHGRLQDSVVTTNATGMAQLGAWTLGLPGANRVAARLSGDLETVFTAGATSAIGYLRLTIAGLPDERSVPLRVVRTTVGGPTYDEVVDRRDTVTLSGIPFGQYAVLGDSLNRGAQIYLPKENFGALTVSATNAPDVTISYVEHGRIETTVRGLPSPDYLVPLVVTEVGGSLTGAITARNDAVVRSVAPLGAYEVSAPTFTIGGHRYAPTPVRQTFNVRSGTAGVAAVSVQYAVVTGSLSITLNGLPSGAAPSVDVTGPNGFRQTFFMSGTRVLVGLDPGTYSVSSADVAIGGTTYGASQGTQTVSVVAGAVPSLTFTYAAR